MFGGLFNDWNKLARFCKHFIHLKNLFYLVFVSIDLGHVTLC